MKKSFNLILLLVIGLFAIVPFVGVKAAYAYSWKVGDEVLSPGTCNHDCSAKWISDDDTYSGGILVLNHYSREPIELECGGTGLNHVWAIKVIGDIVINAGDGVGITISNGYNSSRIAIIGNEGTLTINAAKPLSYENYKNYLYINPSKNIITDKKEETKSETTVEENKESITGVEKTKENKESTAVTEKEEEHKEVKNDTKENNTFMYVMFGILGILFLAIICLIIRINKLNKKIKE